MAYLPWDSGVVLNKPAIDLSWIGAETENKDGKSERTTTEANISRSKCKASAQTGLRIFVFQQHFLPAVADNILLSHGVLEGLTARTASFGLEDEKQTRWLLVFLGGFSPCRHLPCDSALFYEQAAPVNRTRLVEQTTVHTTSHLFQARTVKKKRSWLSQSSLASKTHPLLHNPEFLYLSPVVFFSVLYPPFLSPFCTLLPEKQVE